MKRKFFIGGGWLGGMAVGVWLLVASILAPQRIAIHITDQGFSPPEVHARVGDSLVFINDGEYPSQPASDPHPSHLIYPLLDPRQPLPPHGQWQFLVNRPGIWTYHDHLRTDKAGKIIVRPLLGILSPGAAPTSVGMVCPSAATDEGKQCWLRKISDSVRSQGVAAAYRMLLEASSADPQVQNICHDMTHAIGKEAYLGYRRGEMSVLPSALTGCTWGFYHGFMELFITSGEDIAAAGRLCDQIEAGPADTAAGESLAGCYHGIGHGSAIIHEPAAGSDLWRAIPAGISLCERASPEQYKRNNCVSGVIDGIASVYTAGTLPVSDPVRRQPYRICNEYPAYESVCYSALNWLLLFLSEGDVGKALSTVATIRDTSLRLDTTRWLAHAALQLHPDPVQLAEACRRGTREQFVPCVRGVVGASYRRDTEKPDSAGVTADWCDRFPADMQTVCRAEIAGEAL